jgi:23S rRNA (adenine2503-C2)-methyltransferase
MSKERLLGLTFDELEAVLVRLGNRAFRAEQIWQCVFRELAVSYRAMTTLPTPLRLQLAAELPWPDVATLTTLKSTDKRTTKLLLALEDGETVEAVAMRYDRRNTACISTQVGCAMGCQFCATGRSGLRRNLTTAEIVAQVLTVARLLHVEGQSLSNVVFMGMGEPFANYDATLRSIRILNDPRGLSLGARSFTISTVGLVPGIERLARDPLQVNLAVSLHTADNELRDQLVPANRQYPVETLIRACRRYTEKTHRRVTFEIALIAGINDSERHARQVTDALHGLLCHVNLIPFNPVAGSSWSASPRDRVQTYARMIESAGLPVTVRLGRGVDIQAGCGQLRSREEDGKPLV